MTESRRRWLWCAVAVLAQLVAVYSPDAPSEGGGHGLDKLVHAGLFAAVVWTARRAGLPLVWVVVISALHAPLSEWVQAHFLPGRDGSVGDAVADLVGVAIGTALPVRRVTREREKMSS